jgi:hypothetical protein
LVTVSVLLVEEVLVEEPGIVLVVVAQFPASLAGAKEVSQGLDNSYLFAVALVMNDRSQEFGAIFEIETSSEPSLESLGSLIDFSPERVVRALWWETEVAD